jgi:hypothetical protein
VTRARIRLFLVALLLAAAGQLPAQEDLPVPEVPKTLPSAARSLLTTARVQLVARVEAHNRKVSDFMSRCGQVPAADTALVASCGQEYQAMTAEASSLVAEKRAFTAQVASSINSDPSVVDARNVPSGLPKSVESQLPDTPAGDRVRKGFQAIVDHDWKVARAWFQDALNREPGNAGIQRLIGLAEYSLGRPERLRAAPTTVPAADPTAGDKAAMDRLDQVLDTQMNADLAKALSDYNRTHPATPPAQVGPGWGGFFESLFKQRGPAK